MWIASLGHWFRADDTGGAIVGQHIDVYTEDEDPHHFLESAVYRTDAEVDGHPAAVFLYVEPNDDRR